MKTIKALFLILIFAVVCFGQKTNFKVSVIVESNNKQTQEAIKNYITHGLLSLGDVEMTETDAYYNVIVSGLADENGNGAGYTLSTVINWRATCEKAVRQRKSCYVFDNHILLRGSVSNLQSLCEKIVDFFNSNSLEPLRPPVKN